jgi:hypothetical protein
MAPQRASVTQLFFRHGALWFKDVIRILRLIWLEVTGAIFLALAAFGIPSAMREWRLLETGGSLVRFITTLLFIGMMAGFGIFSFWKARRFR